jgi:hypothetical protein
VVVRGPAPGDEPGVTYRELPAPGPDGARPLEVAPGTTGLRGSLTEGETHRYRFIVGAAPPQHRLSVRIVPSADSAVQATLEAEGVPTRRSAGSAAEVVGFPNLPAEGAGLRLSISPGAVGRSDGGVPRADGARYALLVGLVPREGGDEREPNDTPATASVLPPLTDGPEAAGFLSWARDEDWFWIPLPAGGPAPGADQGLALDFEAPGSAGAEVTVRDGQGRPLAVTKVRPGRTGALRGLALPPPDAPTPPDATAPAPSGSGRTGAPPAAGAVPGDAGAPTGPGFFVQVAVAAGQDVDHRYVLRLRGEALEGSEREPNDRPQTATPAGPGTLRGRLTTGDADVFRLPSNPGVELDVRVEGPSLDLRLELLDGKGRVLARADETRRGGVERLPPVSGGAPGPLFVRVTLARGVAPPDEPYLLTVETRPAAEAGEVEPNDDPGRATLLPPRRAVSARLASAADVDHFLLSTGTALKLRASLGLTVDGRFVDPRTAKEIKRFSARSEAILEPLPPRPRPLLLVVRAGAPPADPEAGYTVEVDP